MKKLLSIFICLQVFVVTGALAQLDGKRFISGSAGVSFTNSNPDLQKASQFYGYNVNVDLGKFKTETRASGWNLNSTLSGRKSSFNNVNGEPQVENGISGFGVGAGYFWQYYKHFNEKFGIFAGPSINGGYLRANEITQSEVEVSDKNMNSVSISLGLNAGLYYKMSERWWLTASLGFATPLSARYQFDEVTGRSTGTSLKSNEFKYEFAPAFTFPSVGLGLRYFLKN